MTIPQYSGFGVLLKRRSFNLGKEWVEIWV